MYWSLWALEHLMVLHFFKGHFRINLSFNRRLLTFYSNLTLKTKFINLFPCENKFTIKKLFYYFLTFAQYYFKRGRIKHFACWHALIRYSINDHMSWYTNVLNNFDWPAHAFNPEGSGFIFALYKTKTVRWATIKQLQIGS